MEERTETRRSDAEYWAKPVRTLSTRDVPAGAIDANVSGRRLQGAASGFGRLSQKTFWVRLDDAKVTPTQVIVAATRNGAELLRMDAGTLQAGKSADFIVLDANPLDDIANTRRISAVVLRGAAVDRTQPVR